MKVTQHPNKHQPVTASPSAPDKAICSRCGGIVILRRRKRINVLFSFIDLPKQYRQPYGTERELY
jgi:predicted nucleic acid-binding Zn ribbon protein